ncbi:MAG: hypothetical protein GTO14_03205 [Anaerolineales bacterium]|nr:hypothetical protein [Anaerolineales bacterium]
MSEEMVVVETTSGVLEAEILRGLLEARGISVRLSHESVATIYGLSVGPLAAVDILVPTSQVSEARQILEDYHAGRLMEEDPGPEDE